VIGRLREEQMIRLIAGASFALMVATSVQAMTPAPIPQPDSMITQARYACGAGRTMVNGVCVARTTIRQARRGYRGYYRSYGRYYGNPNDRGGLVGGGDPGTYKP